MRWLRHRTAVTVGLLAVGLTLVAVGWYEKRGYVDLVAAGVRATEERRLDSRDFERAEGNLFAAPDLLAYNRGIRAYAAGRSAVAAGHFQEVISGSRSASLRALAYYSLGNLLALEGRAREAAEMYREALRLDPSDWDAKANLELLYAQLAVSEGEKAQAALKQAQEPVGAGDEVGQGGPGSGKAGI